MKNNCNSALICHKDALTVYIQPNLHAGSQRGAETPANTNVQQRPPLQRPEPEAGQGMADPNLRSKPALFATHSAYMQPHAQALTAALWHEEC